MRRKRKRQRKRLKEDSNYGLSSFENEKEEENIKSRQIRRRTKGKKSVICSINPPRSSARTEESRNMIDSVFFSKQSIITLSLMFVTCISLTQTSVSASTLTDFDGATFYKASVGSRVRIACNGSHWSDDSVSLVLWFKGTVDRHSVPIYTVDARQRPLNGGARHFISEAYKGRAKFVTKASPPYLDLDPIEADDQSEYRCRIDYRSKPRENFLIILFVLVPPKSVHIMDSRGRLLEQIYGPLSESSNLTLVCISKGGRPAPAITWRIVSDSADSQNLVGRERDSESSNGGRIEAPKVIDDSYLTLNDFLALKRTGQLFSGHGNKYYDNNSGKNNNNFSSWWQQQNSGINNNSNNKLQKYDNDDDDETNQLIAINSSNWPNVTFEGTNSSRSTNSNGSVNSNNGNVFNSVSSTNSINAADPSFSKLEALWLNWRAWPEYEFYSHKLDEFLSSSFSTSDVNSPKKMLLEESLAVSKKQEAPIFVKFNHEQRKRVQAGSSSGSTNSQAGQQSNVDQQQQQQQQQQLLTMDFHESITTSVNVLSLSNLNTAGPLLMPSEADFSETKAIQNAEQPPSSFLKLKGTRRPLLECEASNLHYDLRLLIKLFAPPSLLGNSAIPALYATTTNNNNHPSNLANNVASTQDQVIPPGSAVSLNEASLELQLVEAMQRALEATLRVGTSEVISTSTKLTSVSNQTKEFSFNSTSRLLSDANLATSLRQTKMETNHSNSQQQAAELFLQFSNYSNSNTGASLNGVSIIYHQLSHSHQLSRRFSMLESAGTTNAATKSTQINNNEQQQRQQHNQLVRTRLIALDIYLRPLDVRIDQPERPLSAGQFAEFSCSSKGSQPFAKLTWFKSGLLLDQKLTHTINDSNASTSISRLRLKLERQDHGAQLICRAENEHLTKLNFPGSDENGQLQQDQQNFLEDSITLTVQYSPKVKLELGNKMLTNAIREGSDMYFVCLVDAMPPIKEITWLHNKRPVNESYLKSDLEAFEGEEEGISNQRNDNNGIADGLIISNNSLVLQRVKLEQRGQYACLASNSEGISESNKIELTVLHAPICGAESRLIGGSHEPPMQRLIDGNHFVGSKVVGLKSSVRLFCQMEANPASDLEISWYLNNSNTERRIILGPVKSDESLLLNSNNSSLNEREPENRTSDNENGTDQTNDWSKHSSEQRGSNRDITAEIEAGKGATTTSLTTDKIHTSRLVASVSGSRKQKEKERQNERERQHTSKAKVDYTKGTSQLNYLVDTNLDYGYLYCVARNSIGEQKRACVFEIRQSDLGSPEANIHSAVSANSATPFLECIALNASSNSALIGCNLRDRDREQRSESYKFSTQVYKTSHSPTLSLKTNNNHLLEEQNDDINLVGDQYLDFVGQTSLRQDQLEANLTSALLREPIFLLNNLQASTNYALHVRSLGTSKERTSLTLTSLEPVSIVRFSTSAPQEAAFFQESPSNSSTSSSSPASSGIARVTHFKQDQELTIEPVIEAHQSQKLLSALISTRSTNQFNGKDHQYSLNHLNHLNASRAKIYQQQQTGFLDRVWNFTNSLFGGILRAFKVDNSSPSATSTSASNLNRPPASSKQTTSNRQTSGANNSQLMDASNVYLITSVCLILLASLSFVLFLHRYSSKTSCLSSSDCDKYSKAQVKDSSRRSSDNSAKRNYESYSMSTACEQAEQVIQGKSSKRKQTTHKEGDFRGPGSSSSNVDSESSFAANSAVRLGSSTLDGSNCLERQFNNNKPTTSLSDSLSDHSNQAPSCGKQLGVGRINQSQEDSLLVATTKQQDKFSLSFNQQVKNYGDYLASFNQNNGLEESILATYDRSEDPSQRLYRGPITSSITNNNGNNHSNNDSNNGFFNYNNGRGATLDLALVRNASSRLPSSTKAGNSQNQIQQQQEFYNSLCSATSSSSLLLTNNQQPKNIAKSRSSLCLESSLPANSNNKASDNSPIGCTTHGGGHLINDANLLLNSVACLPSNIKNGTNNGCTNKNREHFLSKCCPSYPVPSSNYAQGKDKYEQNRAASTANHDPLCEDCYDCHLRQRELSHLNSVSSRAAAATVTINNDSNNNNSMNKQLIHHDNRHASRALIGGNASGSYNEILAGSVIETSNDALYISNREIADHLSSQTNRASIMTNEMEDAQVEKYASERHLLNVFVMEPTKATTPTTMTATTTSSETGQANAIRKTCNTKQRAFTSEPACQSSSLISDESSDCTWSAAALGANCILGEVRGTNFTLNTANKQLENFPNTISNTTTAQDQQEMQYIELIPAKTNCSPLAASVVAAALSNSDNSFPDVNLMNTMLVESSFNSLQNHQLLDSLNGTPGQQLATTEVGQFNTCLSLNSPGNSLNSINSSSVNGDKAGPSPSSLITSNSLQNEPPLLLFHPTCGQINERQLKPDYEVHTLKRNQQQTRNLRQHSKILPSILKNSSSKYQQEQQHNNNHHHQQERQAICLCNGQTRSSEHGTQNAE